MKDDVKYKNFQDFLIDRFTKEEPTVLDDQFPDAFDEWVCDIEPDDWIKYAEIYGHHIKVKAHSEEKVRELSIIKLASLMGWVNTITEYEMPENMEIYITANKIIEAYEAGQLWKEK